MLALSPAHMSAYNTVRDSVYLSLQSSKMLLFLSLDALLLAA